MGTQARLVKVFLPSTKVAQSFAGKTLKCFRCPLLACSTIQHSRLRFLRALLFSTGCQLMWLFSRHPGGGGSYSSQQGGNLMKPALAGPPAARSGTRSGRGPTDPYARVRDGREIAARSRTPSTQGAGAAMPARQEASGGARNRARAVLNWFPQRQRWGRYRVRRRAERMSRPARAKKRRRRVLMVVVRARPERCGRSSGPGYG